MSYVFAVVVGSFIGMVAGFTVTWVFDFAFSSLAAQLIMGGIAGAVFGGIIGSIVGDANKSGSSRHQFLVATIFGIAGGMAGGTKMEIVKIIMQQMGVQMPEG